MWAAIAAAVPLVVAIVSGVFSSAGLHRRIKSNAELLPLVKGTPAEALLIQALSAQLENLRDREVARASRKLNRASLALAIVLTLIAAAIIYGLASWVAFWVDNPFQWVSIVVLCVVGVGALIFVVAGFSTIYNPKK